MNRTPCRTRLPSGNRKSEHPTNPEPRIATGGAFKLLLHDFCVILKKRRFLYLSVIPVQCTLNEDRVFLADGAWRLPRLPAPSGGYAAAYQAGPRRAGAPISPLPPGGQGRGRKNAIANIKSAAVLPDGSGEAQTGIYLHSPYKSPASSEAGDVAYLVTLFAPCQNAQSLKDTGGRENRNHCSFCRTFQLRMIGLSSSFSVVLFL